MSLKEKLEKANETIRRQWERIEELGCCVADYEDALGDALQYGDSSSCRDLVAVWCKYDKSKTRPVLHGENYHVEIRIIGDLQDD